MATSAGVLLAVLTGPTVLALIVFSLTYAATKHVSMGSLAATVTPRFLGGPNGALYGNILEHQFGATGTWALGSAMGVVLFVVSLGIIFLVWRTVDLRRAGFTGRID